MAHHLDRAERSGLPDDRCRDQPAHVRVFGERIGQHVVFEVGGPVILDMDDAPSATALPATPWPTRRLLSLRASRWAVGRPASYAQNEPVAIRVVLIDDRAIGTEEAARLVHDGL